VATLLLLRRRVSEGDEAGGGRGLRHSASGSPLVNLAAVGDELPWPDPLSRPVTNKPVGLGVEAQSSPSPFKTPEQPARSIRRVGSELQGTPDDAKTDRVVRRSRSMKNTNNGVAASPSSSPLPGSPASVKRRAELVRDGSVALAQDDQ